jgi:hypothetical protein
VVHASKTAARGASKVRVSRISWSAGDVEPSGVLHLGPPGCVVLRDLRFFGASAFCVRFRYSSRLANFCSQNWRKGSIQPSASFSGATTSVRGRRCASRPRLTRPARSSMMRCLEIVGWLRSNGFMSSDTSASPDASRARIARRVGSASAPKVKLRGSPVSLIAIRLYCHIAIYLVKPLVSASSPL